jgi:tRNA G18 (ribose-2'-O)-methylase SpoU
MTLFEHVRHKPPTLLPGPRPLLLVCGALRNKVNLSRMVRLAGCCGLTRLIHCGTGKLDREIARDAMDVVQVETHRSLPPVLEKLKSSGYRLVGLEQTTNSQCLYEYTYVRYTALVIGSEREGLSQATLDLLDDVIEIPVYGRPYSHNVVTATTMAVYEYCKQFPDG